MRRLTPFFKRFYPVLILLVLEILLFATNYQPGTFLVGWDNLYPELNFSANFKRNIFAIWQEYRGLGLYDGMAYAANLPHTFFLWLLHFFLPLNLLRYLFVFLMHFLGGLGIYLLLERKILKTKSQGKIISLLGALFYLFNLATLQMFFAPLEVFTVHFAFLPWLTFSLLKYLEKPKLKNLLIFSLLSILSLPQGFVPQIFLVYLILTLLILFSHLLQKGRQVFGKVAVCLLIIFSVNAYWALPYAFSIPNNSQTILEAKINQMSSEDIYLKNKVRGTFSDVVLLKGFMLDVAEFTKEGEFPYIMQVWREHLETSNFRLPALIFFSFCLLGLLHTFVKKRVHLFPFGLCLFLSFFFLGNNIWGVEHLNSFARENLPLFAEAFRFPFTKFSLLFAFSYAIFLALGISFLADLFKKHLKRSILVIVLLLPVFVLIGSYAYLSYQGNFLFPLLRLKISDGYLQTIAFFKDQDKATRIATFPQPNFWNWRFHKDGYRGSGFLWYGIEQPMLDRAFDPWSGENENYYWEISYALYLKNQPLFEAVLEKYQINWLLVDENVTSPSTPRTLYFDEIEEMAKRSEKVTLAKDFGNIKIYLVNLQAPVKDFVFWAQNLPRVAPLYKWGNFDRAYLENGPYLSGPTDWVQTYYPFRSLFSGKRQEDLEFEVEERGNFFIFKKDLPEKVKGFTLEIPEETQELVWVNPEDFSQTQLFFPDVYYDGEKIEVIVPKVEGYFSTQIQPALESSAQAGKNCNQLSLGEVKNQVIQEEGKKFLRLSSRNANNCSAAFWLPNLPNRLAYLIRIESRNLEGKPFLFWLENLTIRKPDIETYLPKNSNWTVSYFIQPPMQEDDLAYTPHFDNISIGQKRTVNDLGEINLNPIPYKFLTSLVLVSQKAKPSTIMSQTRVSHPNPTFYRINQRQEGKGGKIVLVLSQSFDKNWVAYQATNQVSRIVPFLGQKINSHVLVNNWANGWVLEETNNDPIVIVFWPQYFEYFGFLLLVGLLIFVVVGAVKERKIS